MSSFCAAIDPRIDLILRVRHSQTLDRKTTCADGASSVVATTHRVGGIANRGVSDPASPVLEGVEGDEEEGELHRCLAEDEGLEPQGWRDEQRVLLVFRVSPSVRGTVRSCERFGTGREHLGKILHLEGVAVEGADVCAKLGYDGLGEDGRSIEQNGGGSGRRINAFSEEHQGWCPQRC
jgi:hypothetical protein